MKKGPGRPRLKAKERLEVFAVRVTSEDAKAYRKAAEAANMSVSNWVRAKLNAAIANC